MESHLQSATRIHLDLACVKLNDTEDKLSETQVQLNDTTFKLNILEDKFDYTEDTLYSTEATLNGTKVELKKTAELLKKTRGKVDTRLFIWKIDGFNEILRQAKAGETKTINSDSFYTEDRTESYGYKLKVEMNPNGQGSAKNTHLSVYITVMKGEYDAILPWPFKKTVKFTVIDQQENPDQRENVTQKFTTTNVPSFLRPVSEQNVGMGFREFISHDKLNSRRYLVDDTLFLQVEVDPSSS